MSMRLCVHGVDGLRQSIDAVVRERFKSYLNHCVKQLAYSNTVCGLRPCRVSATLVTLCSDFS